MEELYRVVSDDSTMEERLNIEQELLSKVTFKVGDVVYLKSGSPSMVISEIKVTTSGSNLTTKLFICVQADLMFWSELKQEMISKYDVPLNCLTQ